VAIIPALNEEQSIGKVLDALPRDFVDRVYVVDNGSTDQTAAVARAHGAEVLYQPERGYGAACLKGMAHLAPETEFVLFIDGDYSDFPEESAELLQPLFDGEVDFVLGSRTLGVSERGSLTLPQQFGNWLATTLIRGIWGYPYTDLGPFRAIRRDALDRLNMVDRNYGWTVEMQIKALQKQLSVRELPVRYRNRIGDSKVSGTVRGVVGAGTKILWTIAKYSRED
jgi:glycosyltransferase involved in cell wall biosynthesis